MKILTTITYYQPYISGLTIFAVRLAKTLALQGHEVKVLTSQYDTSLPIEEVIDGVTVIRVPVTLRISKGVIMAGWQKKVNDLVAWADVVQSHLPEFEAAQVAMTAKKQRKPYIATYHCDLVMPRGLVSKAANLGMNLMTGISLKNADVVVPTSMDYAKHSRVLPKYLQKVEVIPPPIEQPLITQQTAAEFRERTNPEDARPVVGIAGRFTAEKGIEVLLKALPRILEVFPKAMVMFSGPYKKIIGEEAYFERLAPRIKEYEKEGHWKFLGILPDEDMPAFFTNLDVLTMPSLNSTEAFGIVQIEAMQNGTPVVASDLPGVRVPTQKHQMGLVFPPGDSEALADVLLEILRDTEKYKTQDKNVWTEYTNNQVALKYSEIFSRLLLEKNNG